MKKLTRQEIDKRLAKLRETKMNDESFKITQQSFAMCYSMARPKEVKSIRKCANCGHEFEITWLNIAADNIENYDTTKQSNIGKRMTYSHKSMVDKFKDVGMDAMFVCNCESCVQHHNLNAFEMRVKSADETEWHVSVPKLGFATSANTTSDFEYELVLKFLSAVCEKFSKLSYKEIIQADVMFDSDDVGFIKTQIDKALAKVLGLEIIYCKQEVEKNIVKIFAQNNMQAHTERALALLDESGKTQFTVWEYSDFMDDVYSKLKNVF